MLTTPKSDANMTKRACGCYASANLAWKWEHETENTGAYFSKCKNCGTEFRWEGKKWDVRIECARWVKCCC